MEYKLIFSAKGFIKQIPIKKRTVSKLFV